MKCIVKTKKLSENWSLQENLIFIISFLFLFIKEYIFYCSLHCKVLNVPLQS